MLLLSHRPKEKKLKFVRDTLFLLWSMELVCNQWPGLLKEARVRSTTCTRTWNCGTLCLWFISRSQKLYGRPLYLKKYFKRDFWEVGGWKSNPQFHIFSFFFFQFQNMVAFAYLQSYVWILGNPCSSNFIYSACLRH